MEVEEKKDPKQINGMYLKGIRTLEVLSNYILMNTSDEMAATDDEYIL